MAFREGERNAGLMLLHDVNRLCPRHYRTMAEEATRREATQEEESHDD